MYLIICVWTKNCGNLPCDIIIYIVILHTGSVIDFLLLIFNSVDIHHVYL